MNLNPEGCGCTAVDDCIESCCGFAADCTTRICVGQSVMTDTTVADGTCCRANCNCTSGCCGVDNITLDDICVPVDPMTGLGFGDPGDACRANCNCKSGSCPSIIGVDVCA